MTDLLRWCMGVCFNLLIQGRDPWTHTEPLSVRLSPLPRRQPLNVWRLDLCIRIELVD